MKFLWETFVALGGSAGKAAAAGVVVGWFAVAAVTAGDAGAAAAGCAVLLGPLALIWFADLAAENPLVDLGWVAPTSESPGGAFRFLGWVLLLAGVGWRAWQTFGPPG